MSDVTTIAAITNWVLFGFAALVVGGLAVYMAASGRERDES